MYDLIIRNARLIDGSGAPEKIGHLAVKEGRIAAVTDALEALGSARQTIDADGLALMPGIIDSHTHYDAQITWDPAMNPSSSLGVTTVLIGNCGFTIAPCRPQDREITMRNLTQVEGMSLEALQEGIRWDFESFPEYMDLLEQQGSVLNVGAFFGHSSLRTWVMGDAATERVATPDEITQMELLVKQAMQVGAVGFATSTAPQHNGFGGTPMPSRLASQDELQTLVNAMGADGKGVFMLTKGLKTTVDYLESIAASSHRPVVIAALLHNPRVPKAIFRNLADIGAANERGRELYGQVSCCPLSIEFTLQSAYPLEGMDAWKPAMKVHGDNLKQLLLDPDFRRRVREELAEPNAVRLFNAEWHKLQVLEVVKPEHKHLEGRNVQELAEEAGKDPLDFTLDLACDEDLGTMFVAMLLNSDEEQVGQALRDPNATIALSDAGAHLAFFCDAAFGLHLLGHWCRDLGVLTLEQTVHHLTGRIASIYRIPERGLLKPGYCADLLLFDPASVGRAAPRRVHDLPAGAARLTTDAIGVHGVWVNGQRIVDESGLLAEAGLPGKLLREYGA